MSSTRVTDRSLVTGATVPDAYLHAAGKHFRDNAGRTILMHGVNLCGGKQPRGRSTFDPPHVIWALAENGGESFTGTPLSLEDGTADEHLARLRAWGFNVIRYPFTWEALEHAGPGQYDYGFMDYVVEVLRKLKAYGFRVFMDPHQDLFSRFTGGCGAPFWVLPACGIDRRFITPTTAAYLQFEWPDPQNPDPQAFPAMLWATNYSRLAASTLSSMFFAGRDLAPNCVIDGKNIQDWLQDHFIAACTQLAQRIHDAGDLEDSCVIGWDSMNEPNPTYVGLTVFDRIPDSWPLKMGPMPSPLQGMRLGMGMAQKVENWDFGPLGPKKLKDIEIDPHGAVLWLTPEQDAVQGGSKWGWERSSSWPLGVCPWGAHGAWDLKTGEALDKEFFSRSRQAGADRSIDFVEDYWLPFWRKYRAAIQEVHKEAINMVQPPVFEPPPEMSVVDLQQRACATQHFYDGLTLVTKHWNWFNVDALGILRGKYPGVIFGLKLGLKAIRRAMHDQLGYLRQDVLDQMGQYPTLMGELGTPYDLDKRRAYFGDAKGKGKGDYSNQVTALDATLRACEGTNILSFTAWTYDPFNSHLQGDQWNGEDFSFWSTDDIDFAAPRQPKYIEPVPTSSLETLTAPHSLLGKGKTGSLDKLTANHMQEVNERAAKSNHTHPVWNITFPLPVGDLHRGGRASLAFCRAYAQKVVGTPRLMSFDCQSGLFKMDLELSRADARTALDLGQATEVFIPMLHYARWAGQDEAEQYPELVIDTPVPDVLSRRSTLTNSSSDEPTPGLVRGVKGHYEDRPWIWGVHVDHSAGQVELDSASQLLRWRILPTDPIFDSPLAQLARLRPGSNKDHLLIRVSLVIYRRPEGKLAFNALDRTATIAHDARVDVHQRSPWSVDFWGTVADVAEHAVAGIIHCFRVVTGTNHGRHRRAHHESSLDE